MNLPEFDRWELLAPNTILAGFRGSVAHGTYRPNTDPNSTDDIDLMGVHVGPLQHYIGFRRKKQETIENFVDEWDVVSYEIRHYFSLLKKNNPNVMQLLFLPEEMVVYSTTEGQILREHRDLFLSKRAYPAFKGYAYSQLARLEKATGQGYLGEKRKKLIEKHGYDTKYASHLIRILLTGIDYLRTGSLVLPHEEADLLLEIKNGEWPLENIRGFAEDLLIVLKEAKVRSNLPDEPDEEAIEALLMELIRRNHVL